MRSAARVEQPLPPWQLFDQGMPSLFIFFCNLERFIFRRAAAPFGLPTTQLVSRRAPRMGSPSASANVTAAVGTGACVAAGCKSPRGT